MMKHKAARAMFRLDELTFATFDVSTAAVKIYKAAVQRII